MSTPDNSNPAGASEARETVTPRTEAGRGREEDSCAVSSSAPWDGVERREFWGYVNSAGQILPSTIRQRAGDSGSALQKNFLKYTLGINTARLVRVLITWKAQNAIELSDDDEQPGATKQTGKP